MRDKKRIDRIVKLFRSIWKENPDWRFFQTCINVLGVDCGNYYIEDDVWEKTLEMWIKEHK